MPMLVVVEQKRLYQSVVAEAFVQYFLYVVASVMAAISMECSWEMHAYFFLVACVPFLVWNLACRSLHFLDIPLLLGN